jgi:class 3 adenylate cyclase/tetratricopeptide (TPR) repeat protein
MNAQPGFGEGQARVRCPACATENTETRRFCRACGASLGVACARCGAANEPSDRFCGACGARIDAGAPAGDPTDDRASRGPGAPGSARPPAGPVTLAPPAVPRAAGDTEERRWVSVLFADLVGFTALSERLDSEEVRELVTDCLRRLVAEVQRLDGTVEKFIGDAVMAVWGAPVAHEDDPERALRAALGMQRAVEALNRDLEPRRGLRLAIRVGIQSGEVVAGMREVADIRTFSVSGDAVNVAARLQAATEPGTILVGDATVRRIRGGFAFEPVPPLYLKNKAEPVAASRLLSETRWTAVSELRGAPWVGRAEELATLDQCVAEMRRGHGLVALILGDPGLGKSRLLAECRARAGSDSSRSSLAWVRAQAFAHEQGGSYALARRLVQSLAEAPPGPSAPATTPAAGQETLAADAAALAHLVGEPVTAEAAGRLAALSPQDVQRLLFGAIGRLIEGRARQAPLVLELDDLHWADPSSVDLVGELAGLTERLPLLLLCALRPERDSPAWLFRERAARELSHRMVEVVVAPLSEADSARLTAALLHMESLPPALSGVLERAAGTPLWLEELVRTLIERGLIARQEAGWTVSRDVAEVHIPDTLQKLLVARIDRLGEARATLQTASVIGRRFRSRILQEVAGPGGAARLDHDLREAQRAGLVRELQVIPEREYAFKHVLTQEAAYATLLVRRRRELHRAVAGTLIRLYPDRGDELAATLAHHYARAEAWREALAHARQAAEVARAAYANREAAAQYGLALEAAAAAGAPAGERWDLHEALGGVRELLGQFEPARADLEAALGLARTAGDRGAEARLLGALGALWGGHRDYARGLELAEQAVEVAARADCLREEADARLRVGVMRVNLAQVRIGRREAEAALSLFGRLDDESGQARALDVLAMTGLCDGSNRAAVAHAREAIARLRARGDRVTEASCLGSLGYLLATLGDLSAGLVACRESLDMCRTIGAQTGEAFAHVLLAEAWLTVGGLGMAHQEAAAGLALARELSHREWMATGLSALGRAHRALGDPAGARRLHEEMLGICRDLGSALWLTDALSEIGQDLLALGEREPGLARLDEALAGGGDALKFTVRAHLALADFSLRDGRPEEALDRARRFLAAGFEFPVFVAAARRVEGEALAALARADEAEASLRQVQADARALGALPPDWEASLALADLLGAAGRAAEAAHEQARARAVLDRVAMEVTDPSLRASLLATPLVARAHRAVA